jgi:RING-finger-containing ubiquitin ligase
VNTPLANMKSTIADDLVYSVNRGEVRGGYWENGDKLIIYGGLHVRDYKTSTGHKQQADTTLGDVWAYDFKTDTWDMMAATWGLDEYSSGNHPGDRTSHSATVVGDELVVYGGLRKIDIYLWDGSTIWSQLDDIWVFNLNTREWKQRPMAESIGRAYHSVVGWQMPERDGTILTSFGGYKMVIDPVDNQPISYVYDDTMVSMPQIQNTSQPSVWYVAAYSGLQPDTISTRLEHTAVLSKQYGNMFIWGGRYEKTADISGMWSLNVAGDTTTVEYMIRSEDTEVVNTGLAYVILLSVMMMSMMLTYVCGVIHRRSETEANNSDVLNADPTMGGTVFGRNGLGQDIIDTLPLKKYQNENVADTDATCSHGSDGVMDADNDDEHCCPICLVEYEVGDDIRCLPCKHEFHKSCVDPWLSNNASCPACRHSLSELASLTTSVDTFVQSIRATLSATTGRRNNNDSTREPPRETSPTATDRAIAPGIRGLQNLGRILTSRRFNMRSVPSNDVTSSNHRTRIEQVGGGVVLAMEYTNDNNQYDNDSVGDLELSYNASLELNDSMDSGISQESFDSGDVPIEGRPRRMRLPQSSDRRRNRGTGRGRRSRRVRGLNRSTNLDAPLTPADASVV